MISQFISRVTGAFLVASASLGLLLGTSVMAHAEETNTGLVTEYDPDIDSPIPSIVYDLALLSSEGSIDPSVIQADLDYVAGMRKHHAGALTMSEEYLADGKAANPVLKQLARAIIPNQGFEIAVLDEVERQVRRPPKVIDLGVVRLALRPAGVEKLEQRWAFSRTPIPSMVGAALTQAAAVTERDVRFAKAMSIHHQAAIEMARSYNADPKADNAFLGMMNLNIIVDQLQEIALMRTVIARYPGDSDAVKVDPGMVHGMPMQESGKEGAGMHGHH